MMVKVQVTFEMINIMEERRIYKYKREVNKVSASYEGNNELFDKITDIKE